MNHYQHTLVHLHASSFVTLPMLQLKRNQGKKYQEFVYFQVQHHFQKDGIKYCLKLLPHVFDNQKSCNAAWDREHWYIVLNMIRLPLSYGRTPPSNTHTTPSFWVVSQCRVMPVDLNNYNTKLPQWPYLSLTALMKVTLKDTRLLSHDF